VLTIADIGTVMGIFDSDDMISRLRVVFGTAGTTQYLIGAQVEYSYPIVYLSITVKK
jgi:hypothetical protein